MHILIHTVSPFHLSVSIKHTHINQTVNMTNDFSCPHITHHDGSNFPILVWTLPLCGVVFIPKDSCKKSCSHVLTDCWLTAYCPMAFCALPKPSTRSMVSTFIPIQFSKCSTHDTAFMSTNSALDDLPFLLSTESFINA